MKYDIFNRGFASVARATAVAAAFCFAAAAPLMAADKSPTNTPAMTPAPAAAPGPAKEFTEDDVNAAVKKVVDERTKDGAFVFRDPKLNADLNLVFEQIKIVRGMEGYGWFAKSSSTIRTRPRSNTPSTSGSSQKGKNLS
jgi:hypothetical protein